MKNYLPSKQELILVYAVISFFIYAWTIVVFLWKLPSWIMFLTLQEILSIFAYAMVSDMLESIVLLILISVVIALLRPANFKNDYVIVGTWVGLFTVFSMITVLGIYTWRGFWLLDIRMFWIPTFIILVIIFTVIPVRVVFFQTAASWLADRLSIFLYLSIPVSGLSLVYVLMRNIQ